MKRRVHLNNIGRCSHSRRLGSLRRQQSDSFVDQPIGFVSEANIASAYWQIPVHPYHVEATVLVRNSGKYGLKRMPSVNGPIAIFETVQNIYTGKSL